MEGELLQRYSRHFQLPEFSAVQQQQLQNARVLIVGAGGLGLPAALTLATAGIGILGIVDGDVVELSNLHRQWLYTTKDIGENKAVVAVHRLQQRNPHVEYRAYPEFLRPENAVQLFQDYDLIIDATDVILTRYLINDVAWMLHKPVVYGAVYQYEGECSVWNVDEEKINYRDLYPFPPPAELIPSCTEVGVLGAIPNLIGVLQGTEALKLITGIGDLLYGRLLRINAKTAECYAISLEVNPINPLRQSGWEFDPASYSEACISEISVPWQKVEEDENAVLIDIRENWERAQSSAGGIHLPLSEFQFERIPKDRPVYIYCASGIRSMKLVQLLRKHGWTNVWNIAGGIKSRMQQTIRRIPQ